MDIFGLASIDDQVRKEIIRKELHNLTTSYSDEADIFTEIIQNGVDAIEQRVGAASAAQGTLTVVIGRRSANAHYVYVQDDGVGMSADLIEKVFIPNFSFGKKQGASLGYKGVGLSYVLAVSDHLSIKSTKDGITTSRTILHTNDWVMDDEKPDPDVLDEFRAPPVVRELSEGLGEHGSGVFFAFHSGSKPTTLDGLVVIGDGPQKELTYWTGLLAARTPIGLAVAESVKIERPIKVHMILDLGDSLIEDTFTRSRLDLSRNQVGYPYPELVFRVGKDISEIDKTPEGNRHVIHARKHQAVFHEWVAQDFVSEIENLDSAQRELLTSHLQWVHGYLAYSTDVLEQVRKMLGTRRQVIRYGAKLSVDGAPQGRALELTLTSDQGLDRQTHIVLGFSELGLDTGRKFVSDERLVLAINRVTQRVVTKLKEYRWALKIKDREEIASDLTKWRNDVSSRSGLSTIPLLFSALHAQPPALVDPDSEQELVALWTALLTSSALRGYQMKAISGFNRYDALVDLRADAFTSDGYLGVLATDYKAENDAVLEFKLLFDDLIEDFENKRKIPGEIDVAVVWDVTTMSLRHGSLSPRYGKWAHGRDVRAQSYEWIDDTGSIRFPVIALKNVVAELLVELDKKIGQPYLQILENRDEAGLV